MSINSYKDLPVNDLAHVFKLLAEPNRLRILFSMGLECRPVSAIVAATGLTQTNVSFHLRALREAGLVKGERHGSFVFYCLYDTRLLEILSDLERLRQDLLAAQQERSAAAETEPASAATTADKTHSG